MEQLKRCGEILEYSGGSLSNWPSGSLYYMPRSVWRRATRTYRIQYTEEIEATARNKANPVVPGTSSPVRAADASEVTCIQRALFPEETRRIDGLEMTSMAEGPAPWRAMQ